MGDKRSGARRAPFEGGKGRGEGSQAAGSTGGVVEQMMEEGSPVRAGLPHAKVSVYRALFMGLFYRALFLPGPAAACEGEQRRTEDGERAGSSGRKRG